MRTLLVAGLFLGVPAIGADFRGTEFGSPCGAIEERERALSSEQIPVDAINGTAYRFKGRAFDRDVWITYLCKDEVLELGDYHFPHGKYDEGVIDYLAAYNTLVSVYGPPFMAYAQHGEMTAELVIPVVGAATRDEYHASWKVQGLSMHVDLKAHGDYAADNWHAGVIVSPESK